MERNRAAGVLAFILVALLSAAGLAGCGGSDPVKLPPEQRVVDSFLRGIVEGDSAAVLACLPPAWLEGLRGEMQQATDEELGSVISQALWFEFPYSVIEEISYRTEEKDDSTSDVYYWGVFEKTDASGNAVTVTVDEAGARSFNVISIDGDHYLNI